MVRRANITFNSPINCFARGRSEKPNLFSVNAAIRVSASSLNLRTPQRCYDSVFDRTRTCSTATRRQSNLQRNARPDSSWRTLACPPQYCENGLSARHRCREGLLRFAVRFRRQADGRYGLRKRDSADAPRLIVKLPNRGLQPARQECITSVTC